MYVCLHFETYKGIHMEIITRVSVCDFHVRQLIYKLINSNSMEFNAKLYLL